MTNEINKPQETTYWIAYTDSNIFAYGEVDSTQQMTTGQPYLFKTTDRIIWRSKLINDFNTDPDQNIEFEITVIEDKL